MNNSYDELGKALATMIDDAMIYGLDNNAIRWHRHLMHQELRHAKPKWIPQFLWNYILKGVERNDFNC